MQTVRFKNELERNITIKLGYANAKIYKCEDERCSRPMCYKWVFIFTFVIIISGYFLLFGADQFFLTGLMEVGKKIVLCVMCQGLKTAR